MPIRYYYQKNQGKHVATNFAVRKANSDVFLTIDSDDTLLPNAFITFYTEWQKIKNKSRYKGLVCRCVDPDTNKIVGSKLPSSPFDAHTMDFRWKYHISGEMCGFSRTDLMKQYPFPTPDPRMRFCPESIVWFEMGKKYIERIVDVPVREYFHDTTNSLVGNKNFSRTISNYYYWQYLANNVLHYFIYSPKEVLKAYVGVSVTGFRIGKNLYQILKGVKSPLNKLFVILSMPLGYVISKKKQ